MINTMVSTTSLLVVLSVSLTVLAQEKQQCYWRSNSNIQVVNDGWFACNNTQQVAGGAQLCCLGASECGTDALCHQSSSGGGSGWFVGGCTDPTYQDPACRSSCTGDAATWIQYNYTSQLWHCCGDEGCTGTPTSETFQAAPPEQFSAVPSGPQSSSSSSAPTSPPTATTTAAPSGLSTGAQAGIGVAAAVAGIAIAAAIAFFILWRRARKAGAAAGRGPEDRWRQEQGFQQQQQQQVYAHYGSQPANYLQKPPEEMATDQTRTPELAGEEMRKGRN